MKRIHSFLLNAIVLFYLSSSFLSATHFHDDALEQDDCKVCIVHKNLNSADVPTTSTLNLACEYCYETILFHTSTHAKSILKGFNANAPPYLS